MRRLLASPLLRRALASLAVLVVAVFVIDLLSGYRQGQVASVAYFAVAAGGLTLLIGVNGQLSLGHGAFMAIGAYTTALLLQEGRELPVLVLLVAAVLVTMLVGLVVGIAAARLHGPYVAGATLALAIAVPSLAIHFREALGGEPGLRVPTPDVPQVADDAIFFLTGTDVEPTQWLATISVTCLVLTFFLLRNLSQSRVGRRWRAVRDDPVAAQLAGIDLGRNRVLCFVVSTACAGLAGGLMALVTRIAAPSGFTLTLSLSLLMAVVLGGLGTLTGALLGAVLLTLLPTVVTNLGSSAGLSDLQSAELAPLVLGLTTMVVVLLAPSGLVGSLLRLRARSRVTRPTPSVTSHPTPGGTS
ncbi:branched-chain amino acid ABC transporter permease [Janibacter melonis]|uniref:Branched-chain amino acid ABC transporter permease n=1 Tax=Janibacter melonis TaxID=262209 RepID=A0A176QAJ7_9MICO|nr:branched-chain amino acid ABC transporter permease [Janibacter melonis]MBD5831580.1 branched-chain amino acid ABC transporter permease [Janibacter melonis]OAB86705.1 branched-chain amino acid ABC transporter permease [Janibacter melonis]